MHLKITYNKAINPALSYSVLNPAGRTAFIPIRPRSELRGIPGKCWIKFWFLILALLGFLILSAPAAGAITDQERCAAFQEQFKVKLSNGTVINTIGTLPACGNYSNAAGVILMAINLGLGFAGAAAALFIVIGGYWYLTSAGNEESSEKGKKTMTNAIIGLAAVLLSFMIVRVVGNVLIGGSSSSTGTTPASTGSQTPAAGQQASGAVTDADIIALSAGVDMTDMSNGGVVVGAVFNRQSNPNLVDLAKKACAGIPDLTAGALRLYFNGELVGTPKNFELTPSYYSASITLPPSTFTKSGPLIANVCGTQVKVKNITR